MFSVTSSTGFNGTEFSDDDEIFPNRIGNENADENRITKSSASTERDYRGRLFDAVSQIWSSITQRSSDLYHEIKWQTNQACLSVLIEVRSFKSLKFKLMLALESRCLLGLIGALMLLGIKPNRYRINKKLLISVFQWPIVLS